MSSLVPARYWDACTFIAMFRGEQDRADDCRLLLNEARSGKHLAVTSAFTIAEVTGKRSDADHEDQKTRIERFFFNPYFEIVPVDRFLATAARDLVWDYGISATDAIHIASAHRRRCAQFYTFDIQLLALDGKVPMLSFLEPRWMGQAPLPLPSTETPMIGTGAITSTDPLAASDEEE